MSNIKYTQDHEALAVEGDLVRVGITAYAREALGDIVFVELPEIGRALSKGDECAVVESVKTAAEVYASIDGEVTEINEAMADSPEIIAEDLGGEGWIVKIKASDLSQLDALMDEAAYTTFCAEQD